MLSFMVDERVGLLGLIYKKKYIELEIKQNILITSEKCIKVLSK